MRVGVYYHHNRDGSALRCCRAFAEGLARHGVDQFLTELGTDDRGCDVAVCWGARSAEWLGRRPYVLLENGYLKKASTLTVRSGSTGSAVGRTIATGACR